MFKDIPCAPLLEIFAYDLLDEWKKDTRDTPIHCKFEVNKMLSSNLIKTSLFGI